MKKTMIFILTFLFLRSAFPATSSEYFQKGEEFLKDQNNEEALFYFKKSLEKNPYFAKALIKIARINLEMKNYSESELYLKRFLKLAPKDIDGLNLLGNIYLHQDKLARAQEYFVKAKGTDPLNYDTLDGLANVAVKEKNYNLAEDYLKQLLKIDEKREEAYITYAKIYLLKDKILKAEAFIEQGLYYNPGSAGIYFFKGLIEIKKNNWGQAKVYLEKSYSYNPAQPDTILNLIHVYFNMKAWDKAGEFLDKIVARWPDQWLLYNQLGLVHQFNNNIDKSIENFKKGYELNVTDDLMRYHLEDLLIRKKGFYDRDRKELSEYHFNLAHGYDGNFQTYDALYEYKRGLMIQSENAGERDRLGLLYKKNKLLEKYLKELEVASLLDPQNKTLADRLEKARTFLTGQLSHQLKISQYKIRKDRIRIFIPSFNKNEENYVHFQAGKVMGDSLGLHLNLYNKFEPVFSDPDNIALYFNPDRSVIKQMAKKEICDYYLFGTFGEDKDFLSVNFDLFSTRFDEPVRNFISAGKGKDKLYLLSADAAQQLERFFPTTGTILMIKDNQLVVNLGIDDHVKINDRLAIYNQGFLNKDVVLGEYSKSGPEIVGYARIKELDEQISLADLEDLAYLDKVSINNTVKIVPEKKKTSIKK